MSFLPLDVHKRWNSDDQIYSFGYPKGYFQKSGINISGAIGGFTTVDNTKVIQITGLNLTNVNPGYSGAPVFHLQTNKVIGLIHAKYKKTQAFFIPLDPLFKIWLELKDFHDIFKKLRLKLADEAEEKLKEKLKGTPFIPLNLEEGVVKEEKPGHQRQPKEERAHGREWKAFNLDKLFPPDSSYILSSDVGTGKTTFCCWLTKELIKKTDRVPILMTCAEFERKNLDNWDELKEKLIGNYTPAFLKIDLEHFFDKLVECRRCHSRYRVDKLIEEALGITENLEGLSDDNLLKLIYDNEIKCPKCGALNWTDIKKFNLMFTISVGAETDEPNAALRPETTQGSVVEFKKSFMVMRGKLPFALAQVGRVFRNEISPRRALIRMREFQQLEVHIFFDPEDPDEVYGDKLEPLLDYKLRFLRREDRETGKIVEITAREGLETGYTINKLITYWLVIYQKFFNEALGFPLERLRYRELIEGEKAHYALAHWDLEIYTDDLGWVELVNNAYRTDYDLSGHMKVSGNDLSVQSNDGTRKVLPHLYEPSIGLDRVIFHELMVAYREDEERTWLQLPRYLAPVEVGVFPLLRRETKTLSLGVKGFLVLMVVLQYFCLGLFEERRAMNMLSKRWTSLLRIILH